MNGNLRRIGQASIRMLSFHSYGTSAAKVRVEHGWLVGEQLELVTKDGLYYSFKGVPYAEPPLGKLRFMTWQDIRAKTKSRQAAIVHDSRRTGGGPPLTPLNIEEQQVLAVIEPMDIAGERSLIESAVQIDFEEVVIPDVPEECSIESPSILTQSPPPMILLQTQNILTPNINNSQNEQTPSGIQSPAGNVAQSATNSRRPRRQFITNAQRRLQSCVNATQLLSEQGTEKIQIKREYMSMKREYYAAKLKIMNDNLAVQKEQLNVLRNISTTLSTWKK